ncbi:ABC transporter substrate-binding protein [Granulicatella sp. zg-84]|uniref:ABC transporter substrate-binding protein n=1 Tax=Granulicatella sp. zg-84 TaxID=2678503 RepID=UPI0013BEF344|nr:ABC transporter substrate-binding protein [Granulicatella sp. zg-84]NEW65602.1 ABC transporter substrate-binding protein [Granulicatella sp. zg-84]
MCKKWIVVLLVMVTLGACNMSQKTSKSAVRIGVLQYVEHNSLTAARKGFEEELAQQGYKNGEEVVLTVQNAQGEQQQLQTMAEQLVRDSDFILAIATPSAQTLAMVSEKVPVLFTAVTDPVSAELVTSLENPSGLLSGTSDRVPLDKQVMLMKVLYPTIQKVGVLYHTSEQNSHIQVEELTQLLNKEQIEVVVKGVTNSHDIQDTASRLMKEVEVIMVPTDNLIASTMTLLGDLSTKYKVPIIGGSIDMVKEGGLFTYGTDYEFLGRQTAKMAIRLLKGEKIETMAVEYPEVVNLYVNEEIAKVLGIDTSILLKN